MIKFYTTCIQMCEPTIYYICVYIRVTKYLVTLATIQIQTLELELLYVIGSEEQPTSESHRNCLYTLYMNI